ncbi:sigma-54 dependent transcriptional regulator [Wukongibacter baidiensis]|uniref:sigma-54-dependent transcriptional regulator n=1 Tax=Wukongibacter baidiensis TaxID=1723361 RepID=UPI003D7F211C
MMAKILVIEDEINLRDSLEFLLEQESYAVDTVSDGNEAMKMLEADIYDVVICDIRLPGKDGYSLLALKEEMKLKADFIMITAYGSVESAVEAIKKGAEEYIIKPFLNEDLLRTVKKIIKFRHIQKENEVFRKEVAEKYSFSNKIIGKSILMQELFGLVEKISKYDSPVLITGDSGTGKELIAKAIHFHSSRNNYPFVPINCGAIPEGLIESEFFGHAKGAFTGSNGVKKGLLEQGEGGTIFLDEVGEMSLNVQVKLLRALQEKEIRRVGDVQPRKINVRVIAATNKDLEQEIQNGTFREDLYYRLNVIEIKNPSLTERKEDIPLLVEHFIQQYNKNFGRNVQGIEKEALESLMNYYWPGNVRELEHVIQRAIILCDGFKIKLRDLENKIRKNEKDLEVHLPEDVYDLKMILSKAKTIIEKELIQKSLQQKNNNRTAAAKLLGISHRSLMYKMNEYDL